MAQQSAPGTPIRPALPFRGIGNGRAAAARRRVAALPRQRRRSMLALGVLLAGMGALAGAWVYTSTSHRAPVLALTRDVPADAQITSADLAATAISGGSTLKTIPARQEPQVTGQVAAVDLRAGSLLAPADLTSALVPGPGQQLVPVALKAGQLPASGLAPGEHVLVVATPGAAGQPSADQGSSAALGQDVPATVYRVSGPDQTGEVVVDLLVTAGQGPPVARQASTGQVGLVVTPGRR